MTAVTTSTTGVTVASITPQLGAVMIIVETPTMSSTDTFAIDIAKYGGKTFLAHQSYVQTTANSINVSEVATSSVTTTTVTITPAAGNDAKKRTFIIYAQS